MALLAPPFLTVIMVLSIFGNTDAAIFARIMNGTVVVARIVFETSGENKIPKIKVFVDSFDRNKTKDDESLQEILVGKCLENNFIRTTAGEIFGLFPADTKIKRDLNIWKKRTNAQLPQLGTTFNFGMIGNYQKLPLEFEFLEEQHEDSKTVKEDDTLCKVSEKPRTITDSNRVLGISNDVVNSVIDVGSRSTEEVEAYLKEKFAKKIILWNIITNLPPPLPERMETVD